MSNFIDYDVATMQQPSPPQKRTLEKAPAKQVSDDTPKATPVATEPQSEPQVKPQQPVAPISQEPLTKPPATPAVPPKKPAKQQKRSRKKSDENVVYLRNFPVSLVAEAKRQFPMATSQTDAVAALLAIKTGVMEGLSASVLSLISSYEETDETVNVMKNIDTRLSHLEHKSVDGEKLMKELEVACMYLIFDYLGYRKSETPASPRNMDFLEPGVEDIIHRMREQAEQFRKEETIRTGRPIR